MLGQISSFEDNFWGEENKGFGVLLQRLKYGRRTTEALCDFIAARIEIEEEYVKKLQKLSNINFPKENLFFTSSRKSNRSTSGQGPAEEESNPEELASLLTTIPKQTSELCAGHITLIESLKQRLLWPLQQNLNEQKMVKDQQKKEMIRIVNSKTEQTVAVRRFKERYSSRSNDLQQLLTIDVTVLSERDRAKHECRLKKAKLAEQEADAEYRGGTYRLNELFNQWKGRMSIAAQEFQKVEETRIAFSKHIIEEYALINRFHAEEQAASYHVLSSQASICDVGVEVERFIKKYSTGQVIPPPPTCVPITSVEDSIRRLSVTQSSSPRKLNSSSSNVELHSAGASIHRANSNDALDTSFETQSSRRAKISSFIGSIFRGRSKSNISPLSVISDSSRISCQGKDKVMQLSNSMSSVTGDHEAARSATVSPFPNGPNANSSRVTSPDPFGNSDNSYNSNSVFSHAISQKQSISNQGILFRVKTLYSYDAQESDEISFRVNQIINVISTADGPWWYGQVEAPLGVSCRGLFPSNYVERI